MRHCNSKHMYFYPDADTFYSLFTERNIKNTHTHIDGKKGIIEDLEEDIV